MIDMVNEHEMLLTVRDTFANEHTNADANLTNRSPPQ